MESSTHEQVEIQEDVRDVQVESHEGTHEFLLASDQACIQLEEFPSPRSLYNSSDAEVSGITGKNIRKPSCYGLFSISSISYIEEDRVFYRF